MKSVLISTPRHPQLAPLWERSSRRIPEVYQPSFRSKSQNLEHQKIKIRFMKFENLVSVRATGADKSAAGPPDLRFDVQAPESLTRCSRKWLSRKFANIMFRKYYVLLESYTRYVGKWSTSALVIMRNICGCTLYFRLQCCLSESENIWEVCRLDIDHK